MTKTLPIFLVGALLALPGLADGEPTTTITVGGWDASSDGSPDLASEYRSTDGAFSLGLQSRRFGEPGAIVLELLYRDGDDQLHKVDFDVRRFVRSHTDYTVLTHHLQEDPLETLNAATRHGRVVRSTDLSPGAEYGITYRDLDHRTEIQPPGLSALTVGFVFRQQEREGTVQRTSISHCDSCHVVSQARSLDETTRDIGIDGRWGSARGAVKASYLRRTVSEGVRQISLLFDNALQPELRTPIFDDRLQWDSAEGPQPVDVRPDITKNVAKLSASYGDLAGFALGGTGVWQTTENETAGLDSSYGAVQLHAARTFGHGLDVRWRGRAYQLDNDDVFIDAVERRSIAGANAGKTYRQIYGYDPDYLRESALDRDVVVSDLDLGWKLPGKRGKLRLVWQFEATDRENFEVAAGDTSTTKNVVGLDWTVRPAKRARFQLTAQQGFVDNPFMLPDGAYSTLVSSPSASPLSPAVAQYFQFQNARIADTTAEASHWTQIWARGNYGLGGGSSLAASYRYWDGDNDDGDLTDWSKRSQAATLTFSGIASPTVAWHVAGTWHDQEIDMPTTIPLFDG